MLRPGPSQELEAATQAPTATSPTVPKVQEDPEEKSRLKDLCRRPEEVAAGVPRPILRVN